MSLQLALSSEARFTIIYFPRPVQSIISFIHTLLGAPTFLFPPHKPVISVDEINHSNLSTHVLHISFSSSSYLPESDTLFATILKSPHFLLCPSNLSSASFCSTTSKKHSLSCASPYSKSNSHIHNLILRIQNSSVSSSLS